MAKRRNEMIKRPNKEIWDKLNNFQKKYWQLLNWKFNIPEYWSGIFQDPKRQPTDKEAATLAHNLALVAVWAYSISEEEIQSALSRAYCTKRNENKIVDPTLMKDMVKELSYIFGITNDSKNKRSE